jgi:hypothetical protein
MRGHGLLAADHHRLVEVGIDDFALVERHLNPLPICVKVLIGTGNAVHGNGLPIFSEALLFFARPFDLRLGRRRVLLSFLPPLRRRGRSRLRRVVVLVEVGLLLLFFVDVLAAVSEPLIVTPTRATAATASVARVKKPGLAAAAMEPDVIMSCITPSFGGGIPWEEKESGPRRRAGEMPLAQGRRDALVHRSVVLRRQRGEPRHGGAKFSWNMGELAGE